MMRGIQSSTWKSVLSLDANQFEYDVSPVSRARESLLIDR